jgi:hypothetical protein
MLRANIGGRRSAMQPAHGHLSGNHSEDRPLPPRTHRVRRLDLARHKGQFIPVDPEDRGLCERTRGGQRSLDVRRGKSPTRLGVPEIRGTARHAKWIPSTPNELQSQSFVSIGIRRVGCRPISGIPCCDDRKSQRYLVSRRGAPEARGQVGRIGHG